MYRLCFPNKNFSDVDKLAKYLASSLRTMQRCVEAQYTIHRAEDGSYCLSGRLDRSLRNRDDFIPTPVTK